MKSSEGDPSHPADREAEQRGVFPRSRWGLDDGDVSLVLWALRLTPVERLRAAEDFQRGIEALRRARRGSIVRNVPRAGEGQ